MRKLLFYRKIFFLIAWNVNSGAEVADWTKGLEPARPCWPDLTRDRPRPQSCRRLWGNGIAADVHADRIDPGNSADVVSRCHGNIEGGTGCEDGLAGRTGPGTDVQTGQFLRRGSRALVRRLQAGRRRQGRHSLRDCLSDARTCRRVASADRLLSHRGNPLASDDARRSRVQARLF